VPKNNVTKENNRDDIKQEETGRLKSNRNGTLWIHH